MSPPPFSFAPPPDRALPHECPRALPFRPFPGQRGRKRLLFFLKQAPDKASAAAAVVMGGAKRGGVAAGAAVAAERLSRSGLNRRTAGVTGFSPRRRPRRCWHHLGGGGFLRRRHVPRRAPGSGDESRGKRHHPRAFYSPPPVVLVALPLTHPLPVHPRRSRSGREKVRMKTLTAHLLFLLGFFSSLALALFFSIVD